MTHDAMVAGGVPQGAVARGLAVIRVRIGLARTVLLDGPPSRAAGAGDLRLAGAW
ncbi:hypothetical protein [Geodermatophilus normandii]|uniref:Uncharacterized protein n=1 Tax=Geodermatophilus normandii TaxID=1137989 RepID=A0A6P0GFR2_9ACTN|nr:hypothetical protein [Geodermatophilus normandii]NEM06094.1 hypothetical protein [Geodermatophilus normandii]